MRHQLWWGVILIALYFVAGFFYNVAGKGRPPEPASLPHYEALSALARFLAEVVTERAERIRGGSSVAPKYGIGGEEVRLLLHRPLDPRPEPRIPRP